MQQMHIEELQREKQRRMTSEPPEKLILKLAIPTIISMLITTIYNLADTYFVGKLDNTSATGAVGVAFSLMSIIQAIGFFFGHGSGNFISRELGSKNIGRAEEMASVGFFSALFFGGILAVLSFLFLEPIARLLGSTDTILPYAVEYLSYIVLGIPFMCASLVLNNQLRFQGNAFFAMIGLTFGGLLNIVLDPIFIFTFHMGIGGAALATLLSQMVSFVLLLIGVQRSDSLKIRFRAFRPSRYYYVCILKGGTPSLARQGLAAVSTACLNAVAGGFGDPAVAAISIVSRVMNFAMSALIGFGQGFQPVCGFNYGAGEYRRVKRAFLFCVKSSVLFLIALAALLYCFAPELVSLFQKNDTEVIRIGAAALRWQLLALPFAAWTVMSNMMTQTIGKTGRATLLAMSRQGLALIPTLYLLCYFFELDGLLLAQMVADLLSFAIALPLQLSELRELDQLAAARDDALCNRTEGEEL